MPEISLLSRPAVTAVASAKVCDEAVLPATLIVSRTR
jgi:hypothetical protein